MRWPKYWSFSFSVIPSKEIPGLISFRMDWLDLLAVQGTLKSLLQHHSSKASILQHSAFFTVQLSHPYMTTGKTIALTRQTFVGKWKYPPPNLSRAGGRGTLSTGGSTTCFDPESYQMGMCLSLGRAQDVSTSLRLELQRMRTFFLSF